MIDFIVNEKIITFGLLTSIFTATLIGSFKINIIEPMFEHALPSHTLDVNNDGKVDQLDFQILHDAGNYEKIRMKNKKIKWQTFLKDLLMWLIVIFLIYIIYKIIKSQKKNNN